MRRRLLFSLGDFIVDSSHSRAGDFCLYDKTNDKLIIVKGDLPSLFTFPKDEYIPVGVVVVPGNHDVYKDGSCSIISLKHMAPSEPDTGGSYSEQTPIGGGNNEIEGINNLNKVNIVGYNSYIYETVQGISDTGKMPSDDLNGLQNPFDSDTFYEQTYLGKYIPSPYKNNDDRNPAYYQTSSPSTEGNALNDFRGKEKTNIYTALATEQSDWKTAKVIYTNTDKGSYPAACCCWRFHTEGTKQGDWYLPSIGELGYIMPKFKKLNNSLQRMSSFYGIVGNVLLKKNLAYASSTKRSSTSFFSLKADYGYMGICSYDYFKVCARAFLRL